MRVIVFSDTHGDTWLLQEIVEKHLKDADFFIHLGDGAREVDDVACMYPHKQILSVCGNCDFGSDKPYTGAINAGNKRIIYTHGHMYHVKYGLYEYIAAAREKKADIALYGHTHTAYTHYEDGLYVMNPGSLSRLAHGEASYGILDISETSGVMLNIVKVKR